MGTSNARRLKKVGSFVVHQNKGWKIDGINLPNGFHAQLWKLNQLYAANILFCKNGCWATNTAKIESAVFLACLRFQAKTEFEFNFAVPFKRAEFVRYLQLSEEEATALIVLAVAENEDFKAKMKELNHEAFEVLCGALPSLSKERMQKLFEGFW